MSYQLLVVLSSIIRQLDHQEQANFMLDLFHSYLRKIRCQKFNCFHLNLQDQGRTIRNFYYFLNLNFFVLLLDSNFQKSVFVHLLFITIIFLKIFPSLTFEHLHFHFKLPFCSLQMKNFHCQMKILVMLDSFDIHQTMTFEHYLSTSILLEQICPYFDYSLHFIVLLFPTF